MSFHPYRITSVDSSAAHRSVALEERLARATLSGFAATFAMLLAFVVAFSASWLLAAALSASQPVVSVVRLWLFNLTHNQLIDAGRADIFVTAAVYLLGGLFWAILYATIFEPRLAGPGWRKGLLFALVPAVLSVTVFLPLVGGGFFGAAFNAGPLPTLGNFILHAIYGMVLGHLYGPFGSLDASTLHAPSGSGASTRCSTEVMAARGLLVGLLLGLGIGGLIVLVTGTPFDGSLAGRPAIAIVLASAAIGAAGGSAAGAFVGLEDRRERSARL